MTLSLDTLGRWNIGLRGAMPVLDLESFLVSDLPSRKPAHAFADGQCDSAQVPVLPNGKLRMAEPGDRSAPLAVRTRRSHNCGKARIFRRMAAVVQLMR